MKTVILLKDRVYQLRKAEGLTQQQLGEILGLTHKSISMLESGGGTLREWPDLGVRPHKESFPSYRNIPIMEMVYR